MKDVILQYAIKFHSSALINQAIFKHVHNYEIMLKSSTHVY